MLHVKTNLGVSSVHGIGLFAGERISKGEIIYSPSPKLDINLSSSDFDALDEKSKWYISHHGFYNQDESVWHLGFDDIRFCNHSKVPNIGSTPTAKQLVKALRDIEAGEELLQDFNDFEQPLREALR